MTDMISFSGSDRLRIYADGSISAGTTRIRARIVGSSPRELTTDLGPGYAGLRPRPGVRVDVTHVWNHPDLPELVAALLLDAPIPEGFRRGTRRDGVMLITASQKHRMMARLAASD